MAYNPNVYIPPGTPPWVAWQMQNSGARGGPPAPLNMDTLIGSDPLYQGQLRQIGWDPASWAQGGAPQGALGQALAPIDQQSLSALINYGGMPAGMQYGSTLYGRPTDEVLGLAGDATRAGISTLAGLQRSLGYANSFSSGAAAARGFGASGEAGFQGNINNLNYDVSRAGEQQKLMNTLSGFDQQRAAAYNTAMGQAQTSTGDAYQRVVDMIKSGLIADPLTNYTNPNTAYTPGGAAPGAAGAAGTAGAGGAGGYGGTTGHAAPRVTNIPRTRTVTKQPIAMPFHQGQPGNRFQILPGRGRAPIGGGTTWDISANPASHAIRALM